MGVIVRFDRTCNRRHAHLALAACAAWLSGCFHEQSVRYEPVSNRKFVAAPATISGWPGPHPAQAAPYGSAGAPGGAVSAPRAIDTRAWFRGAQAELARYLPHGAKPVLSSDELVREPGEARDVNRYYGVDPQQLHMLLHNYEGLVHSSQATGTKYAIEQPAAAWPGFEDIWIPIDYQPGLQLSARLGLARDKDGNPLTADCIVLLPGIFGDNSIERTKQIAITLRENGFHALAIEMRGCGQTEKRFPQFPMTFGTLEAGDLLAASEWLEDQPSIERTGLIGFCWGSNVALVAAWEDGRQPDDPAVTPPLAKLLRPRTDRRHFRAGILVFSPTLPFEDVCDACETDWSILSNPVLNKLQKEVAARVRRRSYTCTPHSLRSVIALEGARTPNGYPAFVDDGYRYLRLYPYKDQPAFDKFEAARVPVLIVHGCNDPLTDAQYLADVIADTDNRKVAGVVLPGGGHVGFGPYSADYFYGLILRFFDRQRGAAAG